MVIDVRRMGRKRLMPASQIAVRTSCPSFRLLLYAATKTRASLTKMPIKAIMPRMLNRLICAPRIQCPKLMPMSPKGINPNTATPCKGDRNVRMMMKSIMAKINGITEEMLS